MKKSFFLGVMAVAALASCSNDDVVDVNNGKGIVFRTSLDKALTRANVTNLQNLAAFNVTAIGNNASYFTDLSVTTNNNGSTWTTASTYYWPSYQLTFFAYAPQTPGGSVKVSNAEQKIEGFSPAKDVAGQKDLVISYNTGTKAIHEGNGVPMNFKHALSQITVNAKCSNPKIKIEVIGVKLANAAAKADFTFPTAETNTTYTLQQNQWTNLTEKDDHSKAYIIKGKQTVQLTNEFQSIMFGDNNFMLIPQQLTAWKGNAEKSGAYLSVLCRIYSLDNGNETLLYPEPTAQDKKDGKYAFAAVAIDTDWQPGKKYAYNLEFCGNNGGAGKIDPNPTDPEGTNTDVDETPKPDGKGGDPVLGGPIKFTVTVDEWTEQAVEISL